MPLTSKFIDGHHAARLCHGGGSMRMQGARARARARGNGRKDLSYM